MNRNILNYINLVLFIISLIYIINILLDNYDYLKDTFVKIKTLYIFLLLLLAYLINFSGNFLTYLLIKPFIKLKLNKFTEINLCSNLINGVIPFIGTIYKGYVLKKFNFGYLNYINVLFLIRFLQIYVVFIMCFFLILFFGEGLFLKIIVSIAFLLQFVFLFFFKSIQINHNFFLNKYIKNIKIIFNSSMLIKRKVFFNIIIMRIVDFSIFFILVDNIISLEIKTFLTIYVLRLFINLLPVIGSTTTAVVASTFAFSLMDLSFLDSFFINFLHSIIIICGTIMCLLINYIYKGFINSFINH